MKFLIVFILTLLLSMSCTQEEKGVVSKASKISTVDQNMDGPPLAFKEAFKKVDQLPLFGGCSTKECSDQKLINYIKDNLVYPQEAKANKVEGRVYVQFIVEIDGSVSNTYIVKGIDENLDKSALAVVNGINTLDQKWSAGVEKGRNVKVMYTLPITYKLKA